MQKQLEDLAKEYSDTSQRTVNILSKETAEAKGIPAKDYKLSEIENLIAKLSSELTKLKENLNKT